MGVAIKRNVQVVCCAETQADAAAEFAFDQGELTVVKGRSLPIKVGTASRLTFVIAHVCGHLFNALALFALRHYRKQVFRVLSSVEADSATDAPKRSQLVGRQGEVDFIWHIVTGVALPFRHDLMLRRF